MRIKNGETLVLTGNSRCRYRNISEVTDIRRSSNLGGLFRSTQKKSAKRVNSFITLELLDTGNNLQNYDLNLKVKNSDFINPLMIKNILIKYLFDMNT